MSSADPQQESCSYQPSGPTPPVIRPVHSAVTPAPPGTLIGVAALDIPEHLVEVEAVTILA
ncbi:hypothetical protein ACWIGW_20465 [Nocardia brasiliensis]